MAATHTMDGPWVDAGLTGPNPRISGGPLRLVKCEGVVIALMPAWLDDEHEEAHANARIVAAAPDLLEALAVLVEEKADYMRRNNLGDPEREDATKLARAAIAKATGEAL